ncbi:MAG: hypothetical protein Phyf2KO_12750 [Phycisphaerales bacterium]
MTMKQACIACLATGIASGALADTQLRFTISTFDGNNWAMTAELENPTGTVIAAIADLGFTLTGSNISNFQHNTAFDSDFFGPATVSVTSTQVDFIGSNTLPPLNNASGPDSSNPLLIATFQADSLDSFDLVGQVTGAYTGVPFPEILFYQNADGSPGTTTWCVGFYCTPTPGTATAIAIGGALLMRRRR